MAARSAKVGTALMGTGRRLAHLPVDGFPWTAPTWPTGVERLPEKSDLGPDYDTTWARRYPARLARAVLLDGVGRPAIRGLARPEVNGLDRIDHIDTPVVITPNHSSHLDTPLLLTSLPDTMRHKTVVVAGADYFFDKRWKATTWSFASLRSPSSAHGPAERPSPWRSACWAKGGTWCSTRRGPGARMAGQRRIRPALLSSPREVTARCYRSIWKGRRASSLGREVPTLVVQR